MKIMKAMKMQTFGGKVYLRLAAESGERPARRETGIFAP